MRRVCAALLAAGLTLAACDGGTTDTTGSTTTPAGVSGPLFGRITGLSAGEATVAVALFLSGDAARAAAVADGAIAPGEDLPNDFYIDDQGRTESVRLGADTEVLLLRIGPSGSPEPTPATLAEFVAAHEAGFATPEWYGGEYYDFDLVEGAAVRVEQIYLP